MPTCRVVLTTFALLVVGGAAQEPTLLLRDPALSAERIAFVYAGDVWVADRDGSHPRRLTSHPAEELNPVFSPDGQTIAFSAEYEGNRDVYTIPVAGGQPRRLTWHPGADTVLDWSRDGSAVAFASRREVGHGRSQQLYHVPVDGGLPEKQMEARIYRGRYDATGVRFAFIAFGPAYNGLYGGSSGWRGYRGGTTPSVTIMDLVTRELVEIPGDRVNDIEPMWVGDRVCFLSDRDGGVFNIHRFDPATGQVDKLTDESVWDVRAADAHDGTIIYEAGGRLKQLDLASGRTAELRISIRPDLPQLRPQWRDAARAIQGADLSPSGKRVLVTARGEVFSVPVKDGSTRNLSHTATHEYSALWSPDGQHIAWVDAADEVQQLVIVAQTGLGEARRLELGPDFHTLLEWGGDGARVVYENHRLQLWAIEIESGQRTLISTGARRDDIEADTSPDGRFLAYTEEQPNFNRDLMVHDFAANRSHRVTDGLADVASPVFSPDGRYLFFAASTNSGPVQVGLDLSSQEQPYRAALYAVVLAADGKSPLEPDRGDEKATPEKTKGEKGASGDEEKESGGEKAKATRIDLDGLADRMVALPVAERSYGDLAVAKDGTLYFVQRVQPGALTAPPGDRATTENALVRFSFEERKVETVMTGVTRAAISARGEHLLVRLADGSMQVGKVGVKIETKPLGLGGVRLEVDPRAEWTAIFDEVWRMERAYFYDPALHGLDWSAVYARYRPLVTHVGRREDLSALMVEMIGELRVGHNRTGGGDVHRESGPDIGLLGADLRLEGGRHRIARIYTGERWNPFLAAPLAGPGLGVKAGDWLLAVDGRALGATDNVFERLQGTAGKQVTLRISGRDDGGEARDVVVEPTDDEGELRLWAWVEGNRKAVAAATGGRVGYVYLPNTTTAGYTFFNRMFFAQVDKAALIIDERANGGGQAANYITDVLGRNYLSGWKDRDGLIYNTPGGAMYGPRVMLIDQDAGSGGDFLPYAFRETGIGPLIGRRTWGGLIGIAANPELIDGGFVTVPFFRFFDTAGKWSIENEGVAPDIDVALDPRATNEGRDTQLERAIAEVLRLLEIEPSPVPTEAPPCPTELGK